MFEELTVESGETASPWVNVAALYAAKNNDKEAMTAALGQLVWPSGFDQAYATLEFADDTAGTNGSALSDTDGITILSKITKPTTGTRTALQPARFSMVQCVRVKLPAAASGDWTFRIGLRKAV